MHRKCATKNKNHMLLSHNEQDYEHVMHSHKVKIAYFSYNNIDKSMARCHN